MSRSEGMPAEDPETGRSLRIPLCLPRRVSQLQEVRGGLSREGNFRETGVEEGLNVAGGERTR
jgi:hypothetical protein